MKYALLNNSRRATRLCLLSALAVGSGCGDDTTSTETQSSTSTGSSSADTTSTTTPAATEPGTTTDVDPDSSSSAPQADSSSSSTDPTEDTDDTRGDSSSSSGDEPPTSSTGDASSSSTGMEEMPQDCPYGDLTAPDTVSGTTLDQDSEFTTSCGGGGAPDISYLLTAPADGFYVIRASSPGGAIDPIIAAFGGDCGGAEIACDNGTGSNSEIGIQLTEGEVVTVVADGFALGGGAVDISVTFFAGTCPDNDIGNAVPAVFMGDTTMADNTVFGSCGGDTAFDDTLTFTAPADGVYAINTDGSAFDTIMYIRDACDGTELVCNDNVEGATTSGANLNLTEGQEIVVVVDGAGDESGAYTVNIDRDECPDVVLPGTVPQTVTGSTDGEIDASAGSCGGAGAPGFSYSFTAPEAGIYTIDTSGSSFDTVLYAVDGCGGADTQCSNDAGAGTASRINVTLAQDEEVIFVVDGANGESGDFQVTITLDECPDFDLGELVPPMILTATGDTTAEIDSSQPGCGFANGAPDASYTFIAPEDGQYEFDTFGSDYDTILYVLDGATCDGTELACDDDEGGPQSRVLVDLVADQEVTLIVDGFGSASGNYELNARLFDPCGDGILEAPEVCDTTEIGQERCEDLGFAGGSVDCALDCTGLDDSQCSNDIVVVCSTPDAAVNDGLGTTADTITVPDMGTIADVDVFVDVTHTFSGDLDISLSADDLALSNELADSECSGANDTWAFFNDEGSTAVGVNCEEPLAIEGNLIPVSPMSVYDGSEASGEWTLSVTDNVGGDEGTFNEWCLYITLEDE